MDKIEFEFTSAHNGTVTTVNVVTSEGVIGYPVTTHTKVEAGKTYIASVENSRANVKEVTNLAQAVREMRDAQKAYFAARAKAIQARNHSQESAGHSMDAQRYLELSKTLEQKVDVMLKELGDTQTKLF